MNQLDQISPAWLVSRNVIASALSEWGMVQAGAESERTAEAIIARLASHKPPILLEAYRGDSISGLGVPIGVNDRNGKPIHIGDRLRFDEQEWGAPKEFIIELRDGQIHHPGGTGDLSSWCEIIEPWDLA